MAGCFKFSFPIKVPGHKISINSPSTNNTKSTHLGIVNKPVVNHYYPSETTPVVPALLFNVKDCIESFEGRSDILKELSENIEQSLSRETEGVTVKSLIQVLCGVPGAGKTQTVRKFILDNKKKFRHVVWIKAETHKDAHSGFRQIAEKCKIKIVGSSGKLLDDNEVAEEVFKLFCHRKNEADDGNTDDVRSSLFVLDNVEEEADPSKTIMNLLPTSIPANWIPPVFIVTTRQSNWGNLPVRQYIALKGLNDEESWNLVCNSLQKLKMDDSPENRNSVKSVRYLYDGLPLMMQQVLSIVKEEEDNPQYTLDDFLKEIKQNESNCLKTKPKDSDFNESAFSLYETSTKKLLTRVDGKTALYCLDVMALLDPDRIPHKLLCALLDNIDEASLKRAIHLLKTFSLITQNGNDYEIHRVVQSVRKWSKTFTVRARKNLVVGSLKKSIIGRLSSSIFNNTDTITRLVTNYIKYFDTITSKDMDWREVDNSLAFFNNVKYEIPAKTAFESIDNLVDKLHQTERFDDDGMQFLKIALDIAKKSKSTDAVHERMKKLASEYCKYGLLNKAKNMYTNAITSKVASSGLTHLDIWELEECVASILTRQRKFDESVAKYEQILDKRLELQGNLHEDTLTTKTNLALVYCKIGRVEKSRELYLEVIPELEKHLPKINADTLATVLKLAIRLDNQTKYDEAKKLEKHLVEKSRNIILNFIGGFQRVNVFYELRPIYALVVAYGSKDGSIQAEKIIKHLVLNWETNTMSKDFIQRRDMYRTIQRWEAMAAVYQEFRLYEKAERFYSQILSERQLHGNDTEIMFAKYNLARVYNRQDKHNEAIELLNDVLAYLQTPYPPGISWLWGKSLSLSEGEFFRPIIHHILEKENIDQKQYCTKRSELGPHHRETIYALENLAVSKDCLEEHDEVERIYKQVCVEMDMFIKNQHESANNRQAMLAKLISVKLQLARLYKELKNWNDSIILYNEVITYNQKTFGPTHVETLDIIEELAECHIHSSNYAESEAFYDHVLSLEWPPDKAEFVVQCKLDLAVACFHNHKHDNANKLFEEIIVESKDIRLQIRIKQQCHLIWHEKINILYLMFKNKRNPGKRSLSDSYNDSLYLMYRQEIKEGKIDNTFPASQAVMCWAKAHFIQESCVLQEHPWDGWDSDTEEDYDPTEPSDSSDTDIK